MKYILGLTGQTGSGKSTLHSVAEKKGFYVIDCDKVAHCVTEQNEVAKDALCAAFSSDILTGGKIDRKKLARAAFKSKENTELLNKTVLPFIAAEIKKKIEKSESEYILLDAPTLYESGADKMCSSVIALLADEKIRKLRIIERDNLSEEAALLRLKAAKSDEYYIQKADKIIYNNGSIEEYSKQFSEILDKILEERK